MPTLVKRLEDVPALVDPWLSHLILHGRRNPDDALMPLDDLVLVLPDRRDVMCLLRGKDRCGLGALSLQVAGGSVGGEGDGCGEQAGHGIRKQEREDRKEGEDQGERPLGRAVGGERGSVRKKRRGGRERESTGIDHSDVSLSRILSTEEGSGLELFAGTANIYLLTPQSGQREDSRRHPKPSDPNELAGPPPWPTISRGNSSLANKKGSSVNTQDHNKLVVLRGRYVTDACATWG